MPEVLYVSTDGIGMQFATQFASPRNYAVLLLESESL